MEKDNSFVFVPRCVPWKHFQEVIDRLRSVNDLKKLVVLEANPDNVGRYPSIVEVIRYEGSRFIEGEMQRQLAGRIDWDCCLMIVIPVNTPAGIGFGHLLNFARRLSPIRSLVMNRDFMLEPLSTSGGMITWTASFRHQDDSVSAVGFARGVGAKAKPVRIADENGDSVNGVDFFNYAVPEAMGDDEAGIAVFTSSALKARKLCFRYADSSEHELEMPTRSESGREKMKEFLRSYSYCVKRVKSSESLSVSIEDKLGRTISDLNTAINSTIRIDEKLQFGPPPVHAEVAIVVPIFKSYDLIGRQISDFGRDLFLRKQELILLVTSVEDPEDDRKKLKILFNKLHSVYGVSFKILFANRNCGFSMACNFGAQEADAPYLLLLNSDVFPKSSGWLQKMLAVIDDNSEIGIVGSRLLYPDETIQHVGLAWRYEASLANIAVNFHPFRGLHSSLVPEASVAEVPAVTGACMLMRRKELLEMGGLDTNFIWGDYEDSDLCLRFREAGKRIVCDNRSVLYHLEGASYPSESRNLAFDFNVRRQQMKWGGVISRRWIQG